MAPPRKLALCGAVTSIALSTLVLVCFIFSSSPNDSALLADTASHDKGDHPNFFAALAPGGSIHKLPVASGNSPLAKAEKKLSSYAYPRFPAFARSPKAVTSAPKMSLAAIESTLRTDAADLLKDAGPSRAAIAINTPRAAAATHTPSQQRAVSSPAVAKQAALATQAAFPVGSPFPAKGARVIYIGGGDAPSAASEQEPQQLDAQHSMVYVGQRSRYPSNVLVQRALSQQSSAGYNPSMPTESDVLQEHHARAQRLGYDVNNPTAPDMQQWRPAYRQPPLGDVDHGDSIGANDEDQDNTRFSQGYRRPSLQQEFQRMQAMERSDRHMIMRLRGALQRVQEMSARAYTGAQAADVVLGSAAIRLHDAPM